MHGKKQLIAFALGLICSMSGIGFTEEENSSSPTVTKEWTQWGGDSQRNNTPLGRNIPLDWSPGEFVGNPAVWQADTAKNIKWVARLGSQTYGNAVSRRKIAKCVAAINLVTNLIPAPCAHARPSHAWPNRGNKWYANKRPFGVLNHEST